MSDRPATTSRRGFAKAALSTAVAAAAAPALFPAAAALGQAAPPAATPTPVPVPDAPSSVAEALTEVVRIRWGRHLSGEQLGRVAKALDGRLKGAEAMKKVALTNADEPDVSFFAGVDGGR
jgi:hypothetical protein